MDRSFPLGRRARTVLSCGVRGAVVTTLALALVGGTVGSAVADRERQLDRRQGSIGRSIDRQQNDVDQAGARLLSASSAMRSSQVQLASARSSLASTLGQLAAARQLDVQTQQRLADAEQRLEVAEGDLADAVDLVDEARAGIERFAVQSMSNNTPALIGVDALANGGSSAALPEVMSSAESVLSAQTSSVDDLEAAQVLMQLRAARVQELRDGVAAERARAAENLARTAALAQDARNRRQQVHMMVLDQREVRQEAATVRDRDRRILQSMRSERERVSELLSTVRENRAERAADRAAARAADRAAARAADRAAARAADRAAARAAAAPSTAAPSTAAPSTATPSGAAPSTGSSPAAPSTSGPLAAPIPGAYVSSPYGMRLHPIFKVMKLHDGTDFGAACGTPVRAAASGTVVSQSYNAGYGNRVIVTHGTVNGTSLATSYNHLTRYVTSSGQRVSAGQVIGYVGNTGFSTGCHLHFMVYSNGAPTDPAGWL